MKAVKNRPNLNGWQWQRLSTCEVSPLELRCRRLRRGHASFVCDVCGSRAAVSSTPWTYKSKTGTTAPAGLLFLAQPWLGEKTCNLVAFSLNICRSLRLDPSNWRFLHPDQSRRPNPNLTVNFSGSLVVVFCS